MTAKTVQKAPSHTALVAAFYRAMADRDVTVEGIGSDNLAWDQGPLPSFLGERGLDLVEHLDAREMESAYSTGDAGSTHRQGDRFFRFAVARPTAK